mmetsp:Transcript_1389/g.3051  ORF Transcript_1389/g.3051 Transcript_1389/m.3051 type:complete len:209 (-) Transcript_1389:698-1324(-)
MYWLAACASPSSFILPVAAAAAAAASWLLRSASTAWPLLPPGSGGPSCCRWRSSRWEGGEGGAPLPLPPRAAGTRLGGGPGSSRTPPWARSWSSEAGRFLPAAAGAAAPVDRGAAVADAVDGDDGAPDRVLPDPCLTRAAVLALADACCAFRSLLLPVGLVDGAGPEGLRKPEPRVWALIGKLIVVPGPLCFRASLSYTSAASFSSRK